MLHSWDDDRPHFFRQDAQRPWLILNWFHMQHCARNRLNTNSWVVNQVMVDKRICAAVLLLLHTLNGIFSRTTCINQYQKGKTSLDLHEARNDGIWGWQWRQLDHMQAIFTSLQTDSHANISSFNFLRAGCSSWRPANSVKALKAQCASFVAWWWWYHCRNGHWESLSDMDCHTSLFLAEVDTLQSQGTFNLTS